MTEEETVKVRVICPTCTKSNYIMLPKSNIAHSGKGLTTILVPNELICEHSFQIFVDKNGAVRGYETPDFELSFTPAPADEITEESLEIGEKSTYQVIKTTFGEEITNKCIRTLINRDKIFCITENRYLLENLASFFRIIFSQDAPEAIIANTEDYNKLYRQTIHSSENKDAFVFNGDLNAIIKQPFKGNYKADKFAFENNLSLFSKSKNLNDEDMKKKFNNAFSAIFKICEIFMDEISEKKIKNKKEMEKRLQKLIKK
ncbi:MAG: hypothetical protein GY870_20130, partial [archaeon]|nr:hypothetical protein [archaeon]